MTRKSATKKASHFCGLYYHNSGAFVERTFDEERERTFPNREEEEEEETFFSVRWWWSRWWLLFVVVVVVVAWQKGEDKTSEKASSSSSQLFDSLRRETTDSRWRR